MPSSSLPSTTYGVIMAGGGGTRLWPASRRRRPKQFLALAPSGQPLLLETARRLEPLLPLSRLLVVTAAEQADEVRRVLPELPEENLIVEPCGRNTAPCIGLAAVHLLQRDPGALLGVFPADHFVADRARFLAVTEQALRLAAELDALVTVGIPPTRPDTGFGYIEVGDPFASGGGGGGDDAHAVVRFVEKPDLDTARGYLWNSGMFFFSATAILTAIASHLPELTVGLTEIAAAFPEAEAVRVATGRVFPTLRSVSVDYGVMEKASGILVLPGDFGWNDVGNWWALREIHELDADGNLCLGTSLLREARGNVLLGDGRLLAAIGVEDLVVVATADAVLVCRRERVQEVREIVAELERRRWEEYL